MLNSELKAKFVGKKVSVTETTFKRGDTEYTRNEVSEDDVTIAEIKKEIVHSHLRVWLPGMAGTADFRPNRLNIYVEKQDDGSFEVSDLDMG